MARLLRLQDLLSSPATQRRAAPAAWHLPEVAGRLVELSGVGATASLTLACRLVRDAQRRGEPAAWIEGHPTCFFPPDVAESGVDLGALPVVRVQGDRAVARAADHLVRSGAFGLVVLDMGTECRLPTAPQARLAGLARKHGTAVLLLTEKEARTPSVGSLVSLRAEVHRERVGANRFACELRVLKDKRRPPGWTQREVFRGPAGLC